MALKIIWTQTAWNDLEDAADFIAKDSRHYAAAFVQEVRDAARSLTNFAKRGRVVPEFNHEHIRELFIRNHRLIYKISDNTVYILGFIHGARDLWALWIKEMRQH